MQYLCRIGMSTVCKKEDDPVLCNICNQAHIVYDDKQEYDEKDEEWGRHTQLYRDENALFFDTLEGSYNADIVLLRQWHEANHARLCCDKRHKCLNFDV